MNYTKRALAIAATSLTLACSANDTPSDDAASLAGEERTRLAYGDFILANGETVSGVKLVAEGTVAKLIVAASDLPAGTRGFHLHETGSCEGPDFKSAGGHLNPLGKAHGTESEGGSHVGDLPNLVLNESANEPQTFTIDGSLEQVSEWIFDEDGTAVVIHAEPDDYKTDPSGAAGARIACAVLDPDATP
ncbi:superoxide dismutase family protein [Pontixanthobacter aestiaquae]|uniref:Superoxide dismutase family protein n=1 Tax=Pontixanthobacter aestiaquae TaxID=1509367 RepID=A0A844Z7R7_9SPHN|nr:superoxide dismutase family protein [Pontixanthobacter aestiaquae]MDN3647073.1 superoxide dismutase family protein [Pontixanthobacter aestiaquae]MXO81949.1 superoxide dismutase family protein [Pontixanthobacter aestiaquae]